MKTLKTLSQDNGLLAEIRIKDLSNTNLEDYFYTNLLVRIACVPVETQ
jgi:hypothetical protein